jgi:anaerobic magnesium-protoporphyrin IX monomethyl ester cyclase
MKNIVLFQPAIGYMDSMRTKPSLPLGLLQAAAVTSQHYQVRIIDQRIHPNWIQSLRNIISKDTICVGVTSLTGNMIREGLKFSKHVKERYKLPVVWGGVHASLLPKQTVENPQVDIVVAGEGGISLFEVTKAIDEGSSFGSIKGIWYKKDGVPVSNPERPFADLAKLPDTPYHLIDINDYLPLYKGRRSIFFQSSVGCPYKCTYCYNNVFNRGRWRSLSAEETLARIGRLVEMHQNIDDIYFIDDNFFVDLERSRKIIEGLRKLHVTWQIQGVDIVSLEKMDDSFFKLLEDSGCLRLTIGIESGSARIRGLMNKKGTTHDILKTVERLNKFNLIIYCSFIMGIPGETSRDIKETIALLLRMLKINNNVRNSPFYIYTPYPGTKMYEKMAGKGFDMPASLSEWAECEWDKVTIGGMKEFYSSLHFCSLFLDRKTEEYQVPSAIRLLTSIYRPIARFRIKRLFFRIMLEKRLFELTKKIWFPFSTSNDENSTD